jgi:glycosyltransferase 2 family protein
MNELAIKDTAAPSVRGDRSKVFFYLRLALGGLLLVALFRMLDIHSLAVTLASVKPSFVALALLAMMINLLVKTYRWGFILRMYRPDISFGQLARLNFLSLFIGNFLPTSLAHDAVRIYYVSRRAADPRVAISSIFADRVIGNFSLAIAAVSAFVALKLTGVFQVGALMSYGIGVFLLLSLAIPLALRNGAVIGAIRSLLNRFAGRKLFENVHDLSEYLLLYWKHAPLMSKALAIALLNLFIAVLEFYLIARSIAAPVSIHYFFLFIPLVILLSMLPVSVGGLGLLEGALVFFFSSVGVPAETSVSIALLHRAIQLVCLFPGAAFYLLQGIPRTAA